MAEVPTSYGTVGLAVGIIFLVVSAVLFTRRAPRAA
jgi:hypothetical protein